MNERKRSDGQKKTEEMEYVENVANQSPFCVRLSMCVCVQAR